MFSLPVLVKKSNIFFLSLFKAETGRETEGVNRMGRHTHKVKSIYLATLKAAILNLFITSLLSWGFAHLALRVKAKKTIRKV
jgi:hypothetical protein